MKPAACFCSLVLTLLTTYGCSGKTPTSPTTTTTTTTTTATAATPAFSEDFTATVPVNGSSFYSFTVTQYGTVNISMTGVSGQYVPSTVTMGLGLGKPDAETCVPTTSITSTSGVGPQLTGAYDPGVYCVKISDVGNLFSAANVAVTIAYP
ncbi:MAG: hypothetical protein ABI983_04400 [Acidobacteriota bacterium]